MWKCKPFGWLWGLPLIALLWLLLFIGERKNIEMDLTERVATTLEDAGLGWAKTSFTGRDGVLSGTVDDSKQREDAIALAEKTWGVRIIDEQTDMLRKVSPYTWSAEKVGRKLVLEGYIPKREDRNAVLTMAQSQFSDLEIVDNMEVASGVPDRRTFMDSVGFGLKQLSGFQYGKVGLSDRDFSIDGLTRDRNTYGAVNNALVDDLPSSVSLARNSVKAPEQTIPVASPYDWSARKDGSRLVLGGYIPSEDDRAEVLAMAQRRFPGLEIVDQMAIAKGAPKRQTFMDTIDFSFRQLTTFEYGRVSLRDTRYSIEGHTNDRNGFDNVKAALDSDLPRGIKLASKKVTAPEPKMPTVSPYTWSAVRDGGTLELSGYIHDENERTDILASARKQMPGVRIVDNMEIAKGEPTSRQWSRGSSHAFAQLSKLDEGSVSFSDTEYRIKGHTENSDNYSAVERNLQDLPSGFRLAGSEITTPRVDPYTWRADYHSGRVTLSGYMPNNGARQVVKTEAKRRFPDAYIIDNMEVGFGAPSDWQNAANLSLRELARLDSGSASIWERDIEMRGSAHDDDRRTDVRDKMKRDTPTNYLFYDQIKVPVVEEISETVYAEEPQIAELREEDYRAQTRLPRDECQTYLNSLLSSETIRFSTASAKLAANSFPVLTRLAYTANRCPDTRIEIAGHTDSDGSKRFNEFLSLRRARSVVKYLTEQGVLADRLSAIGYGEARPLAPNNSSENKARNRRIEFVVKEF